MKKISSIITIWILLMAPLTVLAVDEFDGSGILDDPSILDSGMLEGNSLDYSLQNEEPINLNSIELLWSTDTYTPFDYQGRALPVKGSSITVSANLKISSGNLNSLKYSWFLDDVFQENESGYGKNVFKFRVRRSNGLSHNLLVKIFNDDRSFYIEKTLEIPITKPELIIYSSNGNSHFSNQASTISTVLADKKFSFIAKPYFFSIKKLTDLVFEWTLSGTNPIISSDYDASIFNLTISDKNVSETAESNLWVSVKNTLYENQKANGSMKINIY